MPPVTLTVVPMGQPIPLDTECCRRRSSLKRPSHSQLESPSHSQLESNPHSVAGSPNLIVPVVQRTHRVVSCRLPSPFHVSFPSPLRFESRAVSHHHRLVAAATPSPIAPWRQPSPLDTRRLPTTHDSSFHHPHACSPPYPLSPRPCGPHPTNRVPNGQGRVSIGRPPDTMFVH